MKIVHPFLSQILDVIIFFQFLGEFTDLLLRNKKMDSNELKGVWNEKCVKSNRDREMP